MSVIARPRNHTERCSPGQPRRVLNRDVTLQGFEDPSGRGRCLALIAPDPRSERSPSILPGTPGTCNRGRRRCHQCRAELRVDRRQHIRTRVGPHAAWLQCSSSPPRLSRPDRGTTGSIDRLTASTPLPDGVRTVAPPVLTRCSQKIGPAPPALRGQVLIVSAKGDHDHGAAGVPSPRISTTSWMAAA